MLTPVVDPVNVNDDQTHCRTWDVLREITGTPRFICTAECKLCSRANMAHIAERGGWFITVLQEPRGHEHHRHTQQKPGKPTWETPYPGVTTSVWELVVTVNQQTVRPSATAGGIFPRVTNLPHDTHSPVDILKIDKPQAVIEKRHEQRKTVAEVVPVTFESPERIDAFPFPIRAQPPRW